jgi:hypothetical protein
LKQLHLEVSELIRISYGPYALEDIRVGQIRQVPPKDELKEFVDNLDAKVQEYKQKARQQVLKEWGEYELPSSKSRRSQSTKDESDKVLL